jgi:hypothetical protein
MLVRSPTVMLLTSPRRVAPYQTLLPAPSFTWPKTVALGATNAPAALVGVTIDSCWFVLVV